MLTASKIIDTIRAESSEMYQQRIPSTTDATLSQIGEQLLKSENQGYLNHFVESLINRIAFTQVTGRMYKNPLGKLKKPGVPLGNKIQEIFINPAQDLPREQNENGKYLLKTTKPDGKVCYYGLSRQSRYPITIDESELSLAFTSEQEFMSFYTRHMQSMYDGDEIDEYLLCTSLFAKNLDEGHIQTVPVSISEPKELSKTMSKISDDFTFAKSLYNGYNVVNADKIGEGETKCITHCPKQNQVLLLSNNAKHEINYEFLANAFNLDLVDLKQMTILVDNIPSTKYKVHAVLLDEQAFQVRDKLYKVRNQEIGSEMKWNFWLHHWQFLYISMFGNCVAFVEPQD